MQFCHRDFKFPSFSLWVLAWEIWVYKWKLNYFAKSTSYAMGPHWTKYKKWQFQPENSKLETTEMEIKNLKPIFKKFSLHYPPFVRIAQYCSVGLQSSPFLFPSVRLWPQCRNALSRLVCAWLETFAKMFDHWHHPRCSPVRTPNVLKIEMWSPPRIQNIKWAVVFALDPHIYLLTSWWIGIRTTTTTNLKLPLLLARKDQEPCK